MPPQAPPFTALPIRRHILPRQPARHDAASVSRRDLLTMTAPRDTRQRDADSVAAMICRARLICCRRRHADVTPSLRRAAALMPRR